MSNAVFGLHFGVCQYRNSSVFVDMVAAEHALVCMFFQFFLIFCHSMTLQFLLAAYVNEYVNINTW